MNNKDKLIFIQVMAIALMQLVAAQAFAVPVSGYSTFQEWSFPTSDRDGVAPDASTLDNPYGDPAAYIGDRASYGSAGWSLITDEMDFFVPNNPDLNRSKDMTITIDWMAGSGQAWPGWPQRPLLSVYPGYADGRIVFPEISILEQEPIAGAPLTRTVFGVTIVPNPMNEWVVFKGDIVVSHVSIDTDCWVPEPATIGLLIGGAIMAIRRNKKALM